ncbi:MAG: IclR family transcriptional regulator [Egibacteraceae bacterium]
MPAQQQLYRAEGRSLGTVRRAARLLYLLSKGPAQQQLTKLAEQSGLSVPTTHRALQSLLAAGLVEQSTESSRYSLGPELVRLSQCYLAGLPVVQVLAPYLVELRKTTKATVKVALLVRGQVAYIDHIDGEHVGEIYRAPYRLPSTFETAAGRVLIARASPQAWNEAIELGLHQDPGAPRYTAQDQAAWAQSAYVALSDPLLSDFLEVAVPITDRRDQALAALSASDPDETFTEEKVADHIVPQLLRAANAVRDTLPSR